MKKIYALYFNEQRLEMKITCEKHWEHQRNVLENNTGILLNYNSNLILSFSRSALVEKSKEIKNEWLKNQYKNISKIANIQLK